MATAPNGYTQRRNSVNYSSHTHGIVTIFTQDDDGIIKGEWVPNDGRDAHHCNLWEDGSFKDREIEWFAKMCSTDTEAMAHWLKEEVLKFANNHLPAELEVE